MIITGRSLARVPVNHRDADMSADRALLTTRQSPFVNTTGTCRAAINGYGNSILVSTITFFQAVTFASALVH